MASATENRLINLYINGQKAGSTLSEIRNKYRQLSAEINRGELSQKEYNQKVAELRQYGAVLNEHRDKVRGIGKSWLDFKNIAMGVVGGSLIVGGLRKITQGFSAMMGKVTDLSDVFADVRKTTDLSAEGISDLDQRLRSIDTRTPREELLKLARDAGKLGISGVENLRQFVKAADQINVALGEDLGEGAIRELGKLNNLFKVSDVYGYEQGMLKLGSVINELGNSSEAAEANILDFTSRLAGVSAQADITFEDVAGIGATLDALGQRSETSGTAISQAIVGMFRDTEAYAKVAGKSVEDFTALLQEDANEAFIQFLDGLNGNNEGLSEMTERFDTLGLNGARAITVLSSLAGNTGKLREQQLLANKAFVEGTSVTEEFDRKNESLAGNIEKIKNAMERLWVRSDVMRGIEGVTASMAEMLEVPVSETIEEQRMRFMGLMGALSDTQTKEEDRKVIIEQLHESYGDRLGDLDLEKATLAEIRTAMAKVNEQYIVEIALMQQRERIRKIADDKGRTEGRRVLNIVDANRQLTMTNEKLGTSYENVAEAVTALKKETEAARKMGATTFKTQELDKLLEAQGRVNIAQAQSTNLGEDLNKERQRELDMIAQLKKEYPELADIIDRTHAGMGAAAAAPDAAPARDEGVEKTVEAVKKKPEAEVDAHKVALDAIKQAKEEEMLYLEEHRAQELVDEEQFRSEMLGTKLTYLLMEKEATEGAGLDSTAVSRQIAQTEIALMESVNAAREEAAAVAQKAADATVDAKKKEEAAMRAAAQAAVESAAMRAAAAVEGANTEYEAAVAIINVIRDVIRQYVIQAIAGAVAKEVASKGLLGIALGAVAAGLAGALFDKLIPPVKMPEKPHFAQGTAFFGGSAIVGEEGKEEIHLPYGSTVFPADITQRMQAANAFSRPTPQPNFAAINEGLTFGQSSQQQTAAGRGGGTAELDLSPLLAEIRAMRTDLRHAQDKEVKLSYRTFLDFRDKYDAAEKRVRMK